MYIHSSRNVHHKQVKNRELIKLEELKLKVEESDRVQ